LIAEQAIIPHKAKLIFKTSSMHLSEAAIRRTQKVNSVPMCWVPLPNGELANAYRACMGGPQPTHCVDSVWLTAKRSKNSAG